MTATAPSRTLNGKQIWPIGLGGASWSLSEPVDEKRSIRTIHAALDAGIQLIDTARAYTTPSVVAHNEDLIRRALTGRSERVVVVTKGGHFRINRDNWGVDGSPAALKRDCRASAQALGVEAIDLYLLHKPDPAVPLAESIATLSELRAEGLILRLGVSNVSAGQLAECRAVTHIDAVQNRHSPFTKGVPTAQDDVLALCESSGIPFLAYSPVRGMLPEGSVFRACARAAGISGYQLALAWLLRQSGVLIPVVGATRPESAEDSAAAASVRLSDRDWDVVDDALKVQRPPHGR